MENYYKLLLAKKANVKLLSEELEKLELEGYKINSDLLKRQTEYTRLYHEIIALRREDEKERLTSGTLLMCILIIIFLGLGTFWFIDAGFSFIKVIAIAISLLISGVGATHIIIKRKLKNLGREAEANVEAIILKEDELQKKQETTKLLVQDLIRTNKKIDSLRSLIKKENGSIEKLEMLIDQYLAPFLVEQIDEAMTQPSNEANMALKRIEKRLDDD